MQTSLPSTGWAEVWEFVDVTKPYRVWVARVPLDARRTKCASLIRCVLNWSTQHLPDWRTLSSTIRRCGDGTVFGRGQGNDLGQSCRVIRTRTLGEHQGLPAITLIVDRRPIVVRSKRTSAKSR